MGTYVEPRFQPYDGWCWKCYHTPLVSENTDLGTVHSGLCGRCFFTDEERREPETWNQRIDEDGKARA